MKLKRRDTFGSAIERVARDPLFGTSADFPRLIEVDLDQLSPRADQPRKYFDEQALRELADSMARVRLLHPLLIREAGNGAYEIVSGERRWRAARLLGWSTIYAIVTTGDPDEIGLIENLQRQDLDALEEAAALHRLMQKHGFTQEELGTAVGRSQGQVSATLRLLTLHPTVRAEYPTTDRAVPRSLMIELATIEDPDLQLALWQRAKSGGLTVRALRSEKGGQPETKQQQAGSGSMRVPATDAVPAVFRAVARIARSLDELSDQRPPLNPAQREQLRDLRQRIDQLLEES